MTKKLVCIACPRGCQLTISRYESKDEDKIIIEGNSCPKGITYGKQESICPMRTLTTTVAVNSSGSFSSPLRRLPVKTQDEIPLEEITLAMHQIRAIAITKPTHYGDAIGTIKTKNGSSVSIVATASTEEQL